MLPEISVPRLGTPGERYRDRQLAIQLPKQDLARAYCRHLNPKHASSADDFMAARNEIALDIGSVQEVLERDLVSINANITILCDSMETKSVWFVCRIAARVTHPWNTVASPYQRASWVFCIILLVSDAQSVRSFSLISLIAYTTTLCSARGITPNSWNPGAQLATRWVRLFAVCSQISVIETSATIYGNV